MCEAYVKAIIIFAYSYSIAPAPFVEKAVFSTLNYFYTFAKKSVGCTYMDLFPDKLIYLTLFFFFKIVFMVLVPLLSHINFRIILSVCTKIFHWDFDRNCIITACELGTLNNIFTILNLPIHEHDMSLHLFRSLIFFIAKT